MRLQKYSSISAQLLLLFSAALLFNACTKKPEGTPYTYLIYKPQLKAKAEVFRAINGNAGEKVIKAGKLCVQGNYIYLNEVEKGIHIIDNSDPSHPTQVGFLEIPGNFDVALRGNTLYADMYSDLLAIDVSNPKQAKVTGQVSNFFVQKSYYHGVAIDTNMVAVAWTSKDTTIYMGSDIYPPCAFCSGDLQTMANAHAPANSTAGSMASMILINDYLYAITEPHSVGIVNISQASMPAYKNSFNAGFDLETIFPFQDKIFLGSSVGMFVYDMSDPVNPQTLGQFSHGRACDPVVTDGNNAYITLRSGTQCGGLQNELDVVDVTNLMQPSQIGTYELTNPSGLSKDGGLLFICDGKSGVRLFDASNPQKLLPITQLSVADPYDVIAGGGHALVVSEKGLYQFDYSNLNNIRQLSFFSLQ